MKTKSVLIGLAVLLTLHFVLPMDTLAQGKGKGPPPWAPAHGYRAKTKHIYFPAHNFYFDIHRGAYIYLSGDVWEVSVTLPSIFVGIDLKTSARVELELTTDTPQKYNADHKVKYKTKVKVKKGNDKTTGQKKSKGKKK